MIHCSWIVVCCRYTNVCNIDIYIVYLASSFKCIFVDIEAQRRTTFSLSQTKFCFSNISMLTEYFEPWYFSIPPYKTCEYHVWCHLPQRYYDDVIDKLDNIWSQNHTFEALNDLSNLLKNINYLIFLPRCMFSKPIIQV